MLLKKRSVTIVAFLLFILSLTVLATDLFKIPIDAGQEYYMDKVFLYGTIIIFWITVPYLLSTLFRTILWKSEFKNTISAKLIGRIEDLTITVIYFCSIGIMLTKLFSVEISFTLILLFLSILAIAVYARPRILKLTKTGFTLSSRPFKVGDWIAVLNHNGNTTLTGKVISFDQKSVQMKSENNTQIILPNSLLAGMIIENYKGIEKDVRFNIPMNLSSAIPIDQAKRILAAGTKHALIEFSKNGNDSIEVMIVKANRDSIDYKINFRCTPWDPCSPEKMKDVILTKVLNHLEVAGIGFDQTKITINVLEHVSLFDSLEKKDLEQLFAASERKFCSSDEEIISQGDAGSSMFVIQEGLVNVLIKANQKEKVKVGVLAPGQFFGEMSLFTGEERSATVVAATDSVILEITKEALKNILERKPNLIDGFGEVIAERQSINMKKMDDYLNRKESLVHKIIGNIKTFFNV